jgi:hypothetical protein
MTTPILRETCPICKHEIYVWLNWRKGENRKFSHECHTHIMPNGCDHYKIMPTPNGASVTISFSELRRG